MLTCLWAPCFGNYWCVSKTTCSVDYVCCISFHWCLSLPLDSYTNALNFCTHITTKRHTACKLDLKCIFMTTSKEQEFAWHFSISVCVVAFLGLMIELSFAAVRYRISKQDCMLLAIQGCHKALNTWVVFCLWCPATIMFHKTWGNVTFFNWDADIIFTCSGF